ncbi:hypothetical protein TGRUB_267725 [Toxoplasma gondii RUB]|uniref:Uncharacterized protein n=2 Tax=Toxoplasma gondii TaxID=5811 RepID=V4ZMH5_TOXGV|nr:hypothetical protein TGVEG_267725 [Toxoplasma gondii VEG]KFG58961.1 hypothetical protein TGRUB_267725 [Toxoplasma gondii RUB]
MRGPERRKETDAASQQARRSTAPLGGTTDRNDWQGWNSEGVEVMSSSGVRREVESRPEHWCDGSRRQPAVKHLRTEDVEVVDKKGEAETVFRGDRSEEDEESDGDDPVVSAELVLLNFPELANTRFFASSQESPAIVTPQSLSSVCAPAASLSSCPTAQSSCSSDDVTGPSDFSPRSASSTRPTEAEPPPRKACGPETADRDAPADVCCAAVSAAAAVRSLGNSLRSDKEQGEKTQRKNEYASPGADSQSVGASVTSSSGACAVQLRGLTTAQPLALVGDCFSFVGRQVRDPLETVVLLRKADSRKIAAGPQRLSVAESRPPVLPENVCSSDEAGNGSSPCTGKTESFTDRGTRKRGKEGNDEIDVVAGLVGRSIDFIVDIQAAAGLAAVERSS